MGGGSDDEQVFKALASPHRRRILDLLREGPLTTGAIDEQLDGLSRYAVMQHLRVLEGSGLVVVRRQGRQRFNHLNAVPVREVYERWVSRLAGDSAEGMLALKRHVERRGNMAVRAINIESEVRLKAPIERVFEAFTLEQDQWYPYSYGEGRLKKIVFEARVGGQVYEDWGDGMGILYGHVAYYDAPKAVAIRSHLKPAITLEQWASFEADGDETILRHATTAFGEISDEMASAIKSHGDLKEVAHHLHAWVEDGKAVRQLAQA